MPKGKGPGAPFGNKNAAGPHKMSKLPYIGRSKPPVIRSFFHQRGSAKGMNAISMEKLTGNMPGARYFGHSKVLLKSLFHSIARRKHRK